MAYPIKKLSELFLGEWNSSTTYTIGDIVDHNGSSFACIKESINNEPPDTTYWALLANKGDKGDAATVDVHSTITGAAGTNALVENVGTINAALLKFTIPRGATGVAGEDGDEVVMRVTDTHIQWKLSEAVEWNDLIALSELKGDTGAAGADGEEISLQKTDTYIQWRLGDGEWQNLVALADIKGIPGEQGEVGIDWQGDWTPGEYTARQAVYHNGSSYVANTTTSQEPPHADWDLIALKGTDGEGSGDVSGPEGATADNIAVFDGTTGKLIKDSGHKLSDYQTALGFTPENSANKKTSLTDNSDTYYPSQKAVKTAVDAKADNPHDNSQHNDLAFEALRFDAQTAPATPSSDSQYVYLTASGTSPNRLLELKIKNQNGIEVVLSSIIV